MNKRKKALIENIAITILLPVILYAFLYIENILYRTSLGLEKYHYLFGIVAFVISQVLYWYIMFYRHRGCGRDFVKKSALLSAVSQCVINFIILYIILYIEHKKEPKGHFTPVVLVVFIIVMVLPFLYNIMPSIIEKKAKYEKDYKK